MSGQLYRRPADEPPSWYVDALGEHRRTAVGDAPISVEMRGGGEVVGELEGASGDVVLVDDHRLSCDQIEGFTLVPEGPLDRSDELRA